MNVFTKRLLKILMGLVLLALLTFLIFFLVYDQPLPEGKTGAGADALAEKMLQALNNDTYRTTRYLEWTFAGGAHHFLWDRQNGKVQVSWNEHLVHLNLNSHEKSIVTKNDVEVLGDQKKKAIAIALAYFNNDSFWLVAPFKVFDKGTERSLVAFDDGSDGLLVTYTSGGNTPGDSYLWKLGDNDLPKSYRMWVKIIPIGGLKASWDNWKVMQNGLVLPTSHKIGPLTLSMGEVKAYDRY